MLNLFTDLRTNNFDRKSDWKLSAVELEPKNSMLCSNARTDTVLISYEHTNTHHPPQPSSVKCVEKLIERKLSENVIDRYKTDMLRTREWRWQQQVFLLISSWLLPRKPLVICCLILIVISFLFAIIFTFADRTTVPASPASAETTVA